MKKSGDSASAPYACAQLSKKEEAAASARGKIRREMVSVKNVTAEEDCVQDAGVVASRVPGQRSLHPTCAHPPHQAPSPSLQLVNIARASELGQASVSMNLSDANLSN